MKNILSSSVLCLSHSNSSISSMADYVIFKSNDVTTKHPRGHDERRVRMTTPSPINKAKPKRRSRGPTDSPRTSKQGRATRHSCITSFKRMFAILTIFSRPPLGLADLCPRLSGPKPQGQCLSAGGPCPWWCRAPPWGSNSH